MHESLLEQVESTGAEVCVLPVEKLLEKAVDAHNDRNGFKQASVRADKHFLLRITLNYIRHQLTNYDEVSFETGPGDPDINKGYAAWRAKIEEAITEAYPDLAQAIETLQASQDAI